MQETRRYNFRLRRHQPQCSPVMHVRDEFPQMEPGAVVCRVAPTFLRFGSLQLPAASGDTDLFRKLTDYVMKGWYPDAAALPTQHDRDLAFLMALADKTADTVARWQSIGFTHGTLHSKSCAVPGARDPDEFCITGVRCVVPGVMNTDNMSLLGLTLDYGPYGFLEA